MELNIDGFPVEVSPGQLTNEELVGLATEVVGEVTSRGLELPPTIGGIATKGVVFDSRAVETILNRGLVGEVIRGDLARSYAGYSNTVEQINSNRNGSNKVEVATLETAEAEFEEWFDEKRLAYVEETMGKDPGNIWWMLLVTPNITIDPKDFYNLAQTFGECRGRPHRTEIWSRIMTEYSPEEVSGTNPDNGKSFKFKLVPSIPTPELNGDVQTQRTKLAELQEEHPFVEATSPLEDLSLLNARRLNGDKLDGSGTQDDTFARNFTLESRVTKKGPQVPCLYITDYGMLGVGVSSIESKAVGRASVG